MSAKTASSERIMTRHPDGKQGVNIERSKYDTMRKALLKVIPRRAEGVAFGDLADLVVDHLDPAVFTEDVSVQWYVVAVKQDLEARGEIEQVPKAKPQRLRRLSKK
jgi:hypothetical protein